MSKLPRDPSSPVAGPVAGPAAAPAAAPGTGGAGSSSALPRRLLLQGMGATALMAAGGCTTGSSGFDALNLDYTSTGSIRPMRPSISVDRQITSPDVMYAGLTDGGFSVPEVPYQKIKPQFRRQIVVDPTGEAPGTIVVHTKDCLLYLVQPGGEAIRYGVGVGRAGLALAGGATVGRKAEWPSWTPTDNMMNRDPRNRRFAGGVPGGLNNPLGARALYLYRGSRDTMFRIHGTNQPNSIGQAMSSGCIRMMNHDVIDLYSRVPVGANVVVLQA